MNHLRDTLYENLYRLPTISNMIECGKELNIVNGLQRQNGI